MYDPIPSITLPRYNQQHTVLFPLKQALVRALYFIFLLLLCCRTIRMAILLFYCPFRLVFGTLYPAYASYKAVRTKNVKEYVKWMMYWIVFALFTCAETFTDVFLSWFPFYYEIKIILVLWLLSPATKGSSILYRKFVHPMLSRREQEIDDYIAKAKEQGYHTVLNLGTKGVNYATTVIMQTAIKGGGGIVNQLRKSYSLSDLTDDTDARADARGLQERLSDEQADVVDPRHLRRRHSPRRSASGSSRVDMYFPEVDVRPGPSLGHVRSTEDVSSGYSSAEPLYVGQPPKLEPREGLVRTASVGGTSRPRTRTTRTSLSTKKTTLPEDSEESENDSEITIIQQIPSHKTKQIIHEESDSSESNDFVDTIGFPAEYVSVQKPVVIEIKSNSPVPEPIQESNVLSKDEPIIQAEKDDLIKKENELVEQSEPIIEVKIEKESSVESFQDTLDTNENDQIIEIIQSEKDPDKNEEELIPVESIKATSLDIDSLSVTSNSQRGGKYNKHIAPTPPVVEKQEDETDLENFQLAPEIVEPDLVSENKNIEAETISEDIKTELIENPTDKSEIADISQCSTKTSEAETHPIKATLVLKPGVIKNIGSVTEDSSKTQIFVSQSPKAKRKSKSKHESPISRLMMLPKKIFGTKDSNEKLKDIEKRKSWHPDTRSLIPASVEDLKSKSDTEDMYEPIGFLNEEKKSVSEIEIAKQRHEENKMILRTLSHSPKQYRRRTRKEDIDFEDSD